MCGAHGYMGIMSWIVYTRKIYKYICNFSILFNTGQGIIYLASHCNLLHKIQVLRSIVVFVLPKLCEACMLHSRGIVQALRWVVEIAKTLLPIQVYNTLPGNLAEDIWYIGNSSMRYIHEMTIRAYCTLEVLWAYR